nr:S-layer homology domain-containing protein [Clostridium sp. Marseille-P7770]
MNKMMWKWKRPAAFLLAAAMIFTMPGVPASAVEAGVSAVHTGLCKHHPEHTKDCGYTEGTKGAACEHEHTEDCYTPVKKCIHEHDESCYPVLEGSVSENTATPSEAEKAQPTACTHECSEESGCITKELSCPHERGEHDESCGYIPATEGTPCGYTCEQCNSQDSGLVPGVSGNAPGECICETHCEKEAVNSDCPVCSAEDADLSACKGTAEAACICEKLCGADAVNPDCTVCSAKGADLSACLGKEEAALAAFALPQAEHTHCICAGTAAVNGHEHDFDSIAWTATDSLPTSDGNYYLTQSVTADWTVPKGEVNLCLNGQTISGSITVGSGATLTLTDCSSDNSGKIQGGVTVNGGTLELYSGTITGGVQVGIKGGTYQTGSSFTMYGGAITGNEDYGGVFLVGTTKHIAPPNFTMHGGTISNNTAGASDGGGGGVYVGEKCSFTMDGGTITGNTATKGNGGGIYIHYNAGSVSISNATITDNKAPATGNTRYGHGGGIYSERGVTVKNVTITGNNSTYEGGGIYGKGAITLTDATVTDNSQYDVYYDGKETTTPELTVSGSVKAGYYANFAWKLPILVSGALSEDSVIRVGVREGINPGAIAEPASGVTLSAENFKADAADSVTSLGNDGKVYLVPCTHEMDDTGYTCKKCKTQFDARVGDSAYYKTLTDAFNAARGSTVTLLRNVTLTGNCSSENYSATLDLNGKTVSTDNKYIHVGGGNKSNTLTVKDSSKGGGTQALNVKFSVGSNGTLAVDDSYTGEISRVELQAGGALERFGGKIGELVLSNAAYGSTSTGYGLKLWKGNPNACTIGKITDNTKSKSLTVNDLLGTDYAKCELYGEKDSVWSIVPKTEKISELTGYTAYKVQFTECVHQCADDSNPVCSVCHKDLYTKITAKAADGTTKTAYFTKDSALENGYVEAIQTLNGWSNEGCTEPTLTLLRDMPYGTSITLTGTLTLESGTHTAKNVTVAENANVTFANGSYKGATINGTATVEAGVTFTDASVTVNGTLNAKGGTFTGNVKFNGSSIANISGGSFNNEKKYGGVEFDYNVTGTISGGTFVFADFYTTKVKLSGGTFTMIKTNGDRKLADLLAEGAAYYGASDNQAVTNDRVNTLENVKVVSHTHNGGKDGNGTCSICGKQMAASLTVGGTTSWYTAFATAIEAANAADGAKTITLYQDVNGYVDGHSTTYELTRGPVTLATGGKTVTRANLTAKGISLTVTGSNGDFNVTVDGKDAELTVNDGNTKLAIVTAQNGGKLSLSNGTFSRVAVKDDGSSASLSGGSYDEITSDTGYVKPYALLAEGYAYKDTKKDKWLPNANSISSKVTVEKAPFAVEKIYPNNDMDYTGNSAFATDGNITLTAVIAPETEGDTYYYWWELFNESTNDWTTIFKNVNTATHTGEKSKTLTISGLPVDKSYQYHIFVQCSNGYNCYSEPFTVTQHQHSWTYTASGATITASCTDTTCTSPNGGSVTIKAPTELTYSGEGKPATVTASSDWQGPAAREITISYIKTGKYGPEMLENGELPTNAGEYTASITVGEATASVTYTIGKATPKAEDFTFTAPTSLTYDGNVKSATVSPAKAGTGDVIVKYYDKDGKEATPKNAGEYTVKIDVAESTNYAAANGLTADGWKFSITKAAAPAAETGSLTITNGTQLTYTYDFKQLLPEAPNGDYGTVRYDLGNRQTAINFTAHGYYLDPEIAEFEGSKLTLVGLYAKDGTATGQIGTVKVNVTTTNYENFQLTLVLNAVNQIKPTPDGEITAAEITYGDALSKSTISGKMKDPDTGKSVNGTFAWTDGTINPNAGDYEADWTFTPAAGYEKYATATGTVTIKVNKATPTFTAPTAQENLTYTGQEQALITAGSVTDYGTMQYSLTENGTYSQDIPTGTDAGAYTVWYRVIGDANHNDTAPASVAVSIGKKPLTITGVTAASKPYDGTTNADISSVTFDNVTLNRGTDYNVTASFDDANVGNGKNATATVTLMGQAAKNYSLEQSSFPTTASITKAAAPDFTKETALTIVNGYEKTYTVTLPALPTLETPKEYGAPTYELGGITLDGSYYTGGAKVENGKLILPIQKNDVKTTGPVGTVTVVIKSTNYEDITLTVNVNATNKLVPTVTAPTANSLTYNGAEQTLVTAGKTTGGTMLYRLGDSEWSEQIPTAKNAGEYTVWYKVQGDAEYADVAEQSLTVTAAKKAVTVTALDKSAHTGSTAPDLSSPETDKDYKVEGLVGADTLSGTVTLDYAQTPDMSKTGKTTINITGTLSNDNYEITYVPGMLTVSNQPSSGGGDSSSGGSGSGGGSSSGDSDDSDNNDNTNQPEYKPQAPVTGETQPIQPDKNGNAAVDNSSVQSAIDKAKQDAKKNGTTESGIAVTVPITSAAGQTSFNVTIKAQTLDLLVKENVRQFTVATDHLVSVNIGLDTLKQLDSVSAGGDIILRVDKVDALRSTEAKAAIGTRPAYDLSLVYLSGGKETPITSLNGHTISVRLPYTPAKGEQTGNLYAVYVDDAGKVEWITKSSYDASQKAVVFETGHFSIYGIGYKNPAPAFTDITGHWAADNILFVASRGLLSGTSDTTFSPGTGMTRGMFVTALGRLAGINPDSYKTGKFTDVKADAYYAPYVNWAAQTGIVEGVTAITFAPDTNINREQMAVIMANYAKKLGYDLPRTLKAVTFADNANISSWAKDAVRAMQQAGILAGKNGNKFDPKGTATRAEVATVLRRFVEIVIDSQTANGWQQNDSGQWSYYRNGKPVKGWLSDDQKWYWLVKATGMMFAGGWKQIDGKWYYFYPDGTMAVNTTIDGYTIGSDGARK